jgi:hypothetical protein
VCERERERESLCMFSMTSCLVLFQVSYAPEKASHCPVKRQRNEVMGPGVCEREREGGTERERDRLKDCVRPEHWPVLVYCFY